MKKLLSVLLVALLLVSVAPMTGVSDMLGVTASAEDLSGTCGENLTWELDTETGLLMISGDGEMYDYSYYSSRSPWDSYCKSIKTVIIENGVTSIGEDAFVMCTNITSVTIPESITKISLYAFVACNNLSRVIIPKSVITLEGPYYSGISFIGANYGTIYLCYKSSYAEKYFTEKNIFFGYADGTEEENTLSGKFGTMNWSFNKLTSTLFIDCNGNMPTMGSESEQPWAGFRSKIRDIAFSETVTSISDYAFYGCNGLTNVTIPKGVTSIGNYAFDICSSLTSVTIPEGVTSIGAAAFHSCTSLTSVTIPGSVTSIRVGAFENCSKLENVVISNGVKIINSNAFRYCSKIKEIIIPGSVSEIGRDAFTGCTSLEKVYIYNKTCSIYSPSIPATATICGFAGSTAETYAKNNGLIFTAMDDTHEHSYTATVVAPTCTKDGYTQYSCICGESYKDNFTNATGHSFGDYVVTTKPTCSSTGTETKTCSVCGATSSRTIAKLEHNFGTWVVTKEATCIATGTETSTCRECNQVTTRTIAKTEHTFGSWVTVNEATCTQNGLEKSVCSYCKNEITRETEKASHSYVVSLVKDATCTETGYTTHTCKNCGDSYIDSIKEIIDHKDTNNDGVCDNCKAVLGTYCNHDYVITYTAPTCTNAGSIKLVCSLCKKESVTTIDSLDHNYVAFTFEPTCTQDGYTKHYCINCGDEYIDAKVKAPGHQMRVEKIVPTCTQNGCDIVICSDCGYNYETKVVKALGHDDFNRDGKCDICNENLGTPENPSDNCSHICHKAQSGGFYKVIYKILVVFWKLFGTNKTCSCGVKHY